MTDMKFMSKLGVRARHRQCVPLMSHFVTSSHLFPGLDASVLLRDPYLAARWAEELGYPMDEDRHILPRVAQYAYIVVHGRDEFDTKMNYLQFLKKELCKQAQESNVVDSEVLNVVRGDIERLTVTEVALSLQIADVGADSNSTLALLARMPFEVYLTTTPLTLLEEALAANGKPDYTSTCYMWGRKDVERSADNASPAPSVDRPLVYHLHGIESDPVSMVFTEDDYFGFFKQLAQDLHNEVQSDNRLPPVISGILGTKSLILLGYSLYDWSFRSFFRGPFRQTVNARTRGVTAQFPPQGTAAQSERMLEYLTEFFRDDRFDLYWGSTDQFTAELMLALGEG